MLSKSPLGMFSSMSSVGHCRRGHYSGAQRRSAASLARRKQAQRRCWRVRAGSNISQRRYFAFTEVTVPVGTYRPCQIVISNPFSPCLSVVGICGNDSRRPLVRSGGRVEYQGIRPVHACDEITLRGKVSARAERSHEVEIWVHAQDGRLRGMGNGTVVVAP
jgi:hypothetical protein